ncbi:hypothetical protein C9439_05195, partial [archaeon SCG-AAA382B04]
GVIAAYQQSKLLVARSHQLGLYISPSQTLVVYKKGKYKSIKVIHPPPKIKDLRKGDLSPNMLKRKNLDQFPFNLK